MKKLYVIYPGRFQPFCRHHKVAFERLVEKFGRSNVYICTSNSTDATIDDKTGLPKSPYNFEDKKAIAAKSGVDDRMFKVDGNLYSPTNVLEKLGVEDESSVAVIYVVGEKDMKINSSRLSLLKTKNQVTGDSYFKPYEKGMSLKSPDEECYLYIMDDVYIMMPSGEPMSGTAVRDYLKKSKDKGVNPEEFQQVMGWYDKKYVPYVLSAF